MTARAVLQACPQRDGCPLVSPHDLRRLDIAPRFGSVLLAAGLSLSLHLGAMAGLAPRDAVLMAGGGDAAPAALGTSFADFAQGMLSPSEAALEVPEVAEAVMPDTAALAMTPPEPAITLPMAPDMQEALMPAVPDAAEPQPMALPDMPAPLSQDLAQTEAQPPDTRPSDLAPETSRKPAPRPERKPAATPPPQGNAPQTAARGSQQGAQGQAASAAPQRAQASTQGTAAAANYPGEVLRQIQRTRQARSPARGQVLVVFSVTNSGALASATIARSSGHAGLDQTALDHIRRAAPFPPPPAGAQRQFSFEFLGR
jgi:protein TonB